MKILSPGRNFFIASIYALIYNYVYGNYIYNVWGSMCDGAYNPMQLQGYVLYILLTSIPFVFYRGLKTISSAFSLFVYAFVYVPFVDALLVNNYPKDVTVSYTLLFFLIMCAFFMTDKVFLLKRLFKQQKKLMSFDVIIVLTFVLLALALVLNIKQLHFVNFFSESEELYSLRAETQLNGIYIVCWLRAAFLPLLLVYYLNRKSFIGVSVVFVAYLLVFMLDKQKLTIIFPFALTVIYFAYIYYNMAFSKNFHIFLFFLFSIVSLIITSLDTSPITLTLGLIIVLRIQCIAGMELERYFDFFVLHDHPHTYYTHIGIIDKLTGLYPYGEQSIGQVVAGDGGNSNAAFWLMDGVAAAGMVGCIIISILFILFKSVMNSLDSRCSVGICVTVLLFGLQAMINMSLMTAIVSNGFLVLFFLFLFVDVGAIERKGRVSIRSKGTR